jgi:hypothetical protein
VIVGGLGFGPESIEKGVPFGYRLHQWEKADYGVVGRSSALAGTKKETSEEGMVWAQHCKEEIGNWEVFLPQLYKLYRVVTNVQYNPFTDLSVEGRGKDVKYKNMKVI